MNDQAGSRSQGVYQSAVNDQAVDRILTTVKRKLHASHGVPEQGTALTKPTKPERTIRFERAKRNTRRGVSQGVYQSAVNDQAGSRSHTHYSQTEITGIT